MPLTDVIVPPITASCLSLEVSQTSINQL